MSGSENEKQIDNRLWDVLLARWVNGKITIPGRVLARVEAPDEEAAKVLAERRHYGHRAISVRPGDPSQPAPNVADWPVSDEIPDA